MRIFSRARFVAVGLLVAAAFALLDLNNLSTCPKASNLFATLGGCSTDAITGVEIGQPAPILMADHSSWLGQETGSKTFSIAVADLNNDSRDDILIGSHEQNPYLYISEDGTFSNQSSLLFPEPRKIDRHGYTLADLDNDGDLDVAISGGGSDGVGKGAGNMLLENMAEEGSLFFEHRSAPEHVALAASRSRSLIPVTSTDGRMVDFYLATLKRTGYPNTMLINAGVQNISDFLIDPQDPLTISVDDHGRGVFADFDNDGKDDYLAVVASRAVLYRSTSPGKPPLKFSDLTYSLKAADFNNDGNLDIFIGRFSPPTHSDRISHDSEKLIYVVYKHGTVSSDAVSLKAQSKTLKFDLKQHIKANEAGHFDRAKGIFIGRDRINPGSRRFTTTAEQASGAPVSLDDPGIYIWHDDDLGRWEIRWRFPGFLKLYKGVITGKGISDVVTSGLTMVEPRQVDDYLLINDGTGSFTRHCNIESQHSAKTVATTVADFNNDGWLDIIGARHGEQGAVNGEIFVLTSVNGEYFSQTTLPLRQRDRLHRADQIVHGFFDEDDKPDVIVTNGYGQIPGTRGPVQLMLNTTIASQSAALVRIQGVTANSFGIGAKLALTDSVGKLIGYRVQGLNSNISQDSQWQHFGLGSSQGPYTLTVEWPDNTTTSHVIAGAGRHWVRQQ